MTPRTLARLVAPLLLAPLTLAQAPASQGPATPQDPATTMSDDPGLNSQETTFVTALWSHNDFISRVAEATGAKVVELPIMCGGLPGTDTWIGRMDLVHERLVAAFGTPVPARGQVPHAHDRPPRLRASRLRLPASAGGLGRRPHGRARRLPGIVGPNGAGKTTLFRGLLGLIPPLAGKVARHTRAIGYVPQRETLDPIYPVTVEEVVRMGAFGELRGWRGLSRAARERAAAFLERVGLAERRASAFSSLSGGQRQRALIGRALMVEPEVLLLDEPTSGVDRRAQARILELLIELNRSQGKAVLLVSHQLGMVRETVRRVAWVADGGVRVGPAAELLAPDNLDRIYGGSGLARSLDGDR